MDLLEYQGKQLFRKHAVPTPEGRHAASVSEAVEAADFIAEHVSKPVLAYIAVAEVANEMLAARV
jgi:succinyl-CoA synthetase beta subunit